MRAARLTSPGTVAVTDVPPPGPSPHQVVVRAATMGICGTDLKIVHGDVPVELPRILGHELVGRVVSDSDPRLPAGTRVIADPAVACGTCAPCRRSRPNLCTNGGLMGREVDGVFAEECAIDAAALLAVPDHVTDHEAGLLQVLGTCVHALGSVDVSPGDTAVVVGLGVAGQLIARLLTARGAAVAGITRSEEKRSLAAGRGAAAVAPPSDAAAVVAELTGGEGPTVVVEAVGTEGTLAQAIELAGPGADVVAFGTIADGGRGLPYYQLYHKELTVWSPRAALHQDYEQAIELMADGRLDVADIVSHTFPLDDVADALAATADPSTLKVLLTNS